MSEEEKKAIEWLKNATFFSARIYAPSILNLIENQQKEIEELNEIKQQICKEELITQDYVQDNFIAKDKIKEKIKELEENNKRIEKQFKGGSQNLLQNYIENIAQIKILKQLLEE